jgi:hypothetical protein
VKGAACRIAVEKDNGIPIMDCRVSGHEKCSKCKQGCHIMDLSGIEKKVSAKFTRFILET